MTSDRLVMRRPDDWHVHLRDGPMLEAVLFATARVFGRAVVMPNLRPPITTVEAARRYRHRIEDALTDGLMFTPLMTAYLTDDLDPNELERGFVEGVFAAAKLYPANATTNSAAGVRDLVLIAPLLERMEAIDMPLLIHGEVTDPDVDVFDREAVFIERHLIPLRQRPVVKRECHRRALVKAATSGLSCFFLGTDSAPHPRSGKESACGCAGIFNAMHAMESYAAVFEKEGALDRLEAFASEFGPRFYGLPLNTDTIALVRQPQIVPQQLTLPQVGLEELDSGEAPVFFHAGESLAWSVDLMGRR